MLEGKFIAINVMLKKKLRSQIKTLEKEQIKPKAGKRNEIIYQSENLWNIKIKRNWWNQKLVLWKGQQKWQNFTYTDQEGKKRNSNY